MAENKDELLDFLDEIQGSEQMGQQENNRFSVDSFQPREDLDALTKALIQAEKSIRTDLKKLPLTSEDGKIESLYSILRSLTKANILVREEISKCKNYGLFDRGTESTDCPLVSAAPVEHGLFRLVLPPLVSRKYSGSYDLYWQAKAAIKQYDKAHEVPDVHGDQLILIYKRYTQNMDSDMERDHDNWETKRITNAISESLNYSDNISHFSIFYTAAPSAASFVEATVLLKKDLVFFLEYLQN